MAWLNGDGEINGADPWDYEYDEEYIPNKLFYHSKIFFDSITAETEKAYLLRINNKMELWIPKKICKNMVLDNEYYESCFVYIHTDLRLCRDKSQSDFHPHSGQETYKKIVKKYKESLDD